MSEPENNIPNYETLIGVESTTGSLFDLLDNKDKEKLSISKEKLLDDNKANNWKELWKGMPDVEQNKLFVKNLSVNFLTMDDYWAFCKLIGATDATERTKAVRFPVTPRNSLASLVWMEKEEVSND